MSAAALRTVPFPELNLAMSLGTQHSTVQPADIGWPTGNGKKVSSIQAGNMLGSCLVSLCFLWAILCPQAVEGAEVQSHVQSHVQSNVQSYE